MKKMQSLVPHMREWFLPRREYFDSFIENDTRVESWFKAELLVLFRRLMKEKSIDDFKREPSLYDEKGKRSQIDFSVTINGIEHYLELKALCISQSKGTPRNLSFYFRDDKVGVIKDLRKLGRVSGANKWIVAFVYPKPNRESWIRIADQISDWKCVTSPEDYPDYIFIALFAWAKDLPPSSESEDK
jgi:hypothetical protein